MRSRVFATIIVSIVLASLASAADVYVSTTTALQSAMRSAVPGTRIIVAPGSYGRIWEQNIHGTAEAMIEIIAADPMNPPVIQNPGDYGLAIYNSSYVLIDGFRVSGALNESVHFGFDDHMILKNIVSANMPGTGNNDTFK